MKERHTSVMWDEEGDLKSEDRCFKSHPWVYICFLVERWWQWFHSSNNISSVSDVGNIFFTILVILPSVFLMLYFGCVLQVSQYSLQLSQHSLQVSQHSLRRFSYRCRPCLNGEENDDDRTLFTQNTLIRTDNTKYKQSGVFFVLRMLWYLLIPPDD